MKDRLTVPRLFLIGFMGAGKSTVGRSLASRLGLPFYDLDTLIEERSGQTIQEIFAAAGESAFRRLETEILRQIVSEGPGVIATGGGTFTLAENREIIQANGVSIWLDGPTDHIIERGGLGEHRPLWQGEEKARELLERRLPAYRQADLRFDLRESTPEKAAEHLAELLRLGKRS